ncbi:MAG: hypothetical protein HY094_00435 [Candidatus Melainabacteria bacterium]|nr:hypothetical protein [Candidatus Melainabacteria bacterium]
MQLTQTKIKQLELIASKFKVNPDLFVDALLDVGLKKNKSKKVSELSNEQKAMSNVDRLLWGSIDTKELLTEELTEYLKTSQKNALELKKRADLLHDRFDAIEIALDLLTCVLENRPPEGATTIPAINDFDSWVIGIKQNLEENDLQRLRDLRQKALASINSSKSIDEIIQEVFPGGKWLDDEEEKSQFKQFNPTISEESKNKVKAIEAEALSKGWAHEQLWHIPDYPRYDQMGLICLVEDYTTIGEITEKHIALIKERTVGDPITNYFYNMKVEQPWITKNHKT